MPYQILRRRDYEPTSAELAPAIRRKADWAIVQLGVRGRTPSTKGTIGHPLPWRRSPVQGSHYYLWWLNAGDSGMALNGHSRRAAAAEGAILVHSIRHHDETDTPLTVGVVSDYEPLDVGLLDPRFDDQEEIALVAQEGEVSFTVIEGMPGSGKSVALLFLARDLATRAGTRKVRYITYTERLKRSARELFDALGPEIAPHITVHTVNDVVKQLSGVEVVSSPYGEISAFVRELDLLSPAQAGLWKAYPLTLYTELRAQVAGRTFPAGYQLPAHREEQMRRHGGQIDVERYARRRKLDLRAAEQSVNLAERMANRFFLDQMMASRALDKLHKGETSTWLAHTDALIIDEVQDFTLLQIALVAEMAAARRKAHPERPLSLTIAGDESQIVQPTGFKWGVTKDLITERIKVHPRDYHFEAQRRSPPLLARLTQKSWELYAHLPKDLRPSAVQTADERLLDLAGDAEKGLVIITPPPTSFDDADWRALLDELAARPGRALIDLTERLDPTQVTGAPTAPAIALSAGADPASEALGEVIFQAREIKGLERGTVLLYGLQEVWARVAALTESDSGNRIPFLEARRLIDQMRVALSRSTSRLIVLDAADASVFAQLAFAPGESALHLALPDLVELLQGEQMTDAEMVLALLDEAEDLAERGRLDEALRRNRRAAAITQQTAESDLLNAIRLQEGDLLIRAASHELAAGHISAAQEAHQAADVIFAALGPSALQGERAERWQRLSDDLFAAAHSEFALLIDKAERALAENRWADAVETSSKAVQLIDPWDADEPADVGTSTKPLPPTGPERDRFVRAVEVSTRANLAHANALSLLPGPAYAETLHTLLLGTARLAKRLGSEETAAIFDRLGKRYLTFPGRGHHAPEDLRTLLVGTDSLLEMVDRLPRSETAAPARAAAVAHVARWLDEMFIELGADVANFYAWATTAAHLAQSHGYDLLDPHVYELERRYLAAGAPPGPFAAFLAAHSGDAATASRIWEKLGEMEMATESARRAGDLERAHTLLRTTHRPIPEDLATAVKAQRLLQQLQQKHATLRPAERAALAEELARLHLALTEEEHPPS